MLILWPELLIGDGRECPQSLASTLVPSESRTMTKSYPQLASGSISRVVKESSMIDPGVTSIGISRFSRSG